jgi:choline dehydrogenase-like flavoprotein
VTVSAWRVVVWQSNRRGDDASEWHGTEGLYAVDDVRYQNPLSVKFLDACRQLGLPENKDFNDWSHPQVTN